MKFGCLILINLKLSLRFQYLDGISVKFTFSGTFRVTIAFHLRLKLVSAIDSVISSMLYWGLKLIFIKWLVLCFIWVWVRIEKHGHTLLVSTLIITIFSLRWLSDHFINFKVHHREFFGADDRFTESSISVAFALKSGIRYGVDFRNLIDKTINYLWFMVLLGYLRCNISAWFKGLGHADRRTYHHVCIRLNQHLALLSSMTISPSLYERCTFKIWTVVNQGRLIELRYSSWSSFL